MFDATESVERLSNLVGVMGPGPAATWLDLGEEDVLLMSKGDLTMSEEIAARVERVCEKVSDFDPGGIEGMRVDATAPVMALDVDGDGVADVDMAIMAGTRGMSWASEMDKKRVNLRSNWALAVATQFRIGLTYQEHVAALGLVTQIELALIAYFQESMPTAGMEWDN